MRRREIKFDVDNLVYLKISPTKGVKCLVRNRNLVPDIWPCIKFQEVLVNVRPCALALGARNEKWKIYEK